MVRLNHPKPLAPVAEPQIRQIDVQVLGDRNSPVGRARLTEPHLEGFEAAWLAFREAYPHYTLEQFIRYLFTKGIISATHAVWRKSIPAPSFVRQSTKRLPPEPGDR